MDRFAKDIKDFKTNLTGKTVLVTGASRGIGKAIAIAFARTQCKLVLAARSKDRLEKTAEEIASLGASAFVQLIDVSQESSILSGLAEIRKNCAPIDILVNNAGIYKTASVAGHPSPLWNEIMSTNLTSAFIFSRELIQDMVAANWGRVINISSISGKHAEIHGAAYSASKFGLLGLTQALALELADKGVTVNAICPGWVNTELAREQIEDPEWCKLNSIDPQESQEIARLSVPQMRFIECDEVAQLAVYLATDMARGITGQAINICGGMCLS
jgi:ketoreductase